MKVTAESRFEDPISKEVGKVASFEMRLQGEGTSAGADGASAGGCSASVDTQHPGPIALLLAGVLGLFGVRRRSK